MTKIESKAPDIYFMGSGVVSEEDASAIMKELEKYNGIFYEGIRMNGLVSIERG
jgi:hypothetical protein